MEIYTQKPLSNSFPSLLPLHVDDDYAHMMQMTSPASMTTFKPEDVALLPLEVPKSSSHSLRLKIKIIMCNVNE